MKLSYELVLLLVIIIFFGWLLYYFTSSALSPASSQSPLNFVCVRGKCFFVELAKSFSEKEKGLMYRKDLGKDKGMLFIFDREAMYPFWMKNTFMPLDIIWINKAGKIVFIGENIQPCKTLLCPETYPDSSATYVLELNAGISRQFGFEKGDLVEINIQK